MVGLIELIFMFLSGKLFNIYYWPRFSFNYSKGDYIRCQLMHEQAPLIKDADILDLETDWFSEETLHLNGSDQF